MPGQRLKEGWGGSTCPSMRGSQAPPVTIAILLSETTINTTTNIREEEEEEEGETLTLT